jgi:hypothetical protein
LPLFLAFGLQLWESKEHSIYDQNWMPATCQIEELVITHESLYMHGDYLRNDHPNDGIYYVLQPSWRSVVTPIPQKTRATRERVSCCRQSHAANVVPSGLTHMRARNPPHPWEGIVVDEILPIDGERCEGPIGYNVEETMALCQRDLHWTLPHKVQINQTYPCFYVAHGSTHVYLNVDPPRLELFTADLLTVVFVLIAVASASALVSTHPAVQPRLEACCCPIARGGSSTTGRSTNGAPRARPIPSPHHAQSPVAARRDRKPSVPGSPATQSERKPSLPTSAVRVVLNTLLPDAPRGGSRSCLTSPAGASGAPLL